MKVEIRIKQHDDGKYYVTSKEYLIPAGLDTDLEKAKDEFIEELAEHLEIDPEEIELEVIQ